MIRSLFIENSLFRHRLAQSTAYTWTNLLLLSCLLAVGFFQLIRGFVRNYGLKALAIIPAEQQKEYYDTFMMFGGGDSPGAGLEGLPGFYQCLAFLTILALLAMAVLQELFMRKAKNRWLADEYRIPLKPGQIMLAQYDCPILKIILILVLSLLVMMLPARSASYTSIMGVVRLVINFDFIESLVWWSLPDVPIMNDGVYYLLWVFPQIIFLFGLHRSIIYFKFMGRRVFYGKLIWGWSVWLALLPAQLLEMPGWFELALTVVRSILLICFLLPIPRELFEKKHL